MKLSNEVQEARRRALEAARREEQEIATRARDNRVDLEKAAAAQERLEAIDADLDRQIRKKTAELRARAEGRRAKELRAAGAAYAAIRDRGTAVKDLARKAGVPEKTIRECITAHEGSGPPAGAKPKASGAGQAIPSVGAGGEAPAQPSEPTREQLAG
jgi:predicted transcriptional regulator